MVVITLVISWFSVKNIFAAYSISVNNLPQSINANEQQDFSLEVNVSLGSNSEYYLRAVFSHPDSPSSYFGYTDGYNGTEAKSFYKISTSDKGEWSGILKIRPDSNSPYFKGEGIYNFKIGYYTSSGSGPNWKYENTIFLVYLPPSPTPTQSLAPTLTPTPTPKLPTPTPTIKPTATYKINEVKDEDGEILSSVKVYIDEIYLHHYAPEVLTFCDDCQCDTYVSCNFGQHTIKLEKTGYEDWSETKIINPGDFYEVSPVMNFSQPSPTSSPKITPTPTPTLKSNLTTPKPTPNDLVSDESTESGEILGSQEATFSFFYPYESTEEAKDTESTTSAKNKIFPKIFLIFGLILLFVSAFWAWFKIWYTHTK